MMRLTRRYRFASSHRLHAPGLTAEENRRTYGKCNNPYGHGHDYVLEVSVSGPVDRTGRVVDPAALDALVEEKVIRCYHQMNLNTQVAEFAVAVPTSENVALDIAGRLSAEWPARFGDTAARLERVKLWETRRNMFEVRVR